MYKQFFMSVLMASVCAAQVTLPDGTQMRVRLEKGISSATADEGQSVELAVTEDVKVNNIVVIAEGAKVAGTITEATGKRRMGRAGKLDFSIDKVRAVDGEWIPLRYSVQKKSGSSHGMRTGIITAGVAVAFWPAAPLVLLMKGKDVTLNKGLSFDVFTDTSRAVRIGGTAQLSSLPAELAKAEPRSMTPAPAAEVPSVTAPVTIVASIAGADIEVDGLFVGNSPTTVQMKPGLHVVVVKSAEKLWQRNLQVTPGSTITLNASFVQNIQTARAR